MKKERQTKDSQKQGDQVIPRGHKLFIGNEYVLIFPHMHQQIFLAYVPDLSLPYPETDGYSQEEEGTIARQGG